MTKDEILKILNSELPFLGEKYGISKIGLFGFVFAESRETG